MDKVVHFEIPFDDKKRAMKFYSEVDQALAKAQAAGGKVVTPKTPIPGMGAFARVTDTEGNVVGCSRARRT